MASDPGWGDFLVDMIWLYGYIAIQPNEGAHIMVLNLYKMKAQVAKALSHESRLIIIDALKEKDMCVHDLTKLVGADQSTVSKHLSVLKGAGILEDRTESNKVYYHLKTPCVINFFDCALEVIRSRSTLPTV
jgi:ArsR family transcriptional regulator